MPAILTPTSPGGGGEFDGVHNDLPGRAAAGAHPAGSITGLGAAALLDPAEVVGDPDAQAALSATFAKHAESITVPARVWSAVFGLPSLEALGNTVPAWMLRDSASDYIGMSVERGADDGFAIPDSWAAYDVQVQVAAASGSGDVVLVWQHRAETGNPGSSMTSAEPVTASLTTALQWVTLAEGVPVPTGGAALRARIYRHGQNAADTLSGYAGITKVRLTANPS